MARAREVAESSKRRAGMKKEKAKARARRESPRPPTPPDWLPGGWIVEERVGPSGRKFKVGLKFGSVLVEF